MIDPLQLLHLVIRPVLQDMGLYSENAERLILGTACQESECGLSLAQLDGGPALGIYQMEPATHDDIWAWLEYPQFRKYREHVIKWMIPSVLGVEQLMGNFYYATAMTRIHYLRVKEPIPDTLYGQAKYWDDNYNRNPKKGTPNEYIGRWYRFIGGQLI